MRFRTASRRQAPRRGRVHGTGLPAWMRRDAQRRGRRCAVQARIKGQSPERPVPPAERGHESASESGRAYVSCFSRHLSEWSFRSRSGRKLNELCLATPAGPVFQGSRRAKPPTDAPAGLHRAPPAATRPEAALTPPLSRRREREQEKKAPRKRRFGKRPRMRARRQAVLTRRRRRWAPAGPGGPPASSRRLRRSWRRPSRARR